jgi:hypothetical protein
MQSTDETLVDPSLRQAYDHFGHNAVSLVRNNRYGPDSLYSKLSKLHQENKSSEALDLLYIILEDKQLKQRMKDWTWSGNVELGMDMYKSDEDEVGLGIIVWPELSSTNVSLTASVPIIPAHQTATVMTASHAYNNNQQPPLTATTEKQQKVQLSIGGQSNLKSGFGSTSGILSCRYMPVPQTSINSEITIGHSSVNTSLSSSTQLINGTDLSAQINHQYYTSGREEEDGGGVLVYGFTSSRRLTIFHGRTVHAMFALGLTSNFIMNYGILSFTTWGLFNTTSSSSDNQQPLPRLSTKLSIGTQYPIECSIEQKELFNSSFRSGQASMSWSPVRGCKWNVMLSRRLPRRRTSYHESDFSSKLGIGIQHTAMSGLKWIFHYQRPEGLSIRIPIFILNFISPQYWSTVIWISTISYLFDETMEELKTMSNTSTTLTATNKFGDYTPDKQISKRIRVNEYEQQWLQSSNAKRNAFEQMLLINPIARIKRQREEAVNGLVILKATYASTNTTSNTISLDVVQQLQFWVNNSRLYLPPQTKGMLLGFYDLSHEIMKFRPQHEFHTHRWMHWMNCLLTRFGVRGWGSEFRHYNAEAPVTLTVRYKFGDGVYEITIDDNDELDLPSSAAVILGSSHIVS